MPKHLTVPAVSGDDYLVARLRPVQWTPFGLQLGDEIELVVDEPRGLRFTGNLDEAAWCKRCGILSDNCKPYAEALFRTYKYPPHCPSKTFASLDEVGAWTQQFVLLLQPRA